VERRERLERRATRLDRKDAVALVVLSTAIFWRDSVPVQLASKVLVGIFSTIFSQAFFVTLALLVVILKPIAESVIENEPATSGPRTQAGCAGNWSCARSKCTYAQRRGIYGATNARRCHCSFCSRAVSSRDSQRDLYTTLNDHYLS
jgi:hypothetical protein